MMRTRLLFIFFLSLLSGTASAQLSDVGISELDNRLLLASPTTIATDEELAAYMNGKAESAIQTHCVSCHGADLQGQIGVPNLVDYDWLWGITGYESNSVEPMLAILQTITYGIRYTDCPEDTRSYGACPDTHFSQMPSFNEIGYTPQQMMDLTQYTLDISSAQVEVDAEASARGKALWPVCIECHAEDGYGYKPYGGPDLRDDIWLFGSSTEQVYDVIFNGRTESCPAWGESLDAVTIKALTLYIYSKAFAY